ncbi:hypothetical protein Ade02nite_67130 [Paractinoplanes deccanensis]|uniref:Uncharacterized protein n=1 Tax=Paractinoplanes deccanensis TaxID=113561 RepID=A0ABQ3YDK7_9ACTN|nr:hypothetical protein [Actinoplanes deccanensis]GID78072.1 hypothetical protein Ade02nite_67130 [Actinoplanes deccanensis]
MSDSIALSPGTLPNHAAAKPGTSVESIEATRSGDLGSRIGCVPGSPDDVAAYLPLIGA